MEKTRHTFDAAKANNHFAKVLREQLCTSPEKAKDLAQYLGVSIQSVNQFKQGAASPKLANLVKIAEYYGVSIDYLYGISNVRSPKADIKATCQYTGLSESAVNALREMDETHLEALSSMLECGMAEILVPLWDAIQFAKKDVSESGSATSFNAQEWTVTLSFKDSVDFFKNMAVNASRDLIDNVISLELQKMTDKDGE